VRKVTNLSNLKIPGSFYCFSPDYSPVTGNISRRRPLMRIISTIALWLDSHACNVHRCFGEEYGIGKNQLKYCMAENKSFPGCRILHGLEKHWDYG